MQCLPNVSVITLNLKGNDTTINQPTTYTKDEDGNWVYVYTNLDVFDGNGNKINYTWNFWMYL